MTARLAPFSPAEEALLAGCGDEARVVLGDGARPVTESPEVAVRASLLRALLTDAESPLNTKGLRLRGAWITGALDLQGVATAYDITLSRCVLTAPVGAVNARLAGVHVTDCRMAGLAADNARFDGSLFLRAGTVVEGEISLAGARVAGDLQLCALSITAPGQDAVFAPQLHVTGSLFIGNYTYGGGEDTLEADGALFLSSLRVDHDVFITRTAIAPRAPGSAESYFNATEEHGAAIALSLARARVGGILYMRDNQIAQGTVNLAGAEVARFRDEPEGPGASYPVRLDGFRYGDFSRHAETALAARLDWLERRPADTPFTAQPYEQLARVLTHMGHRRDARTVLFVKERLLREQNRREMPPGPRRALAWAGDLILRVTVGYGYRSGRILGLAVVLIAGLGWFFDRTWAAGDMTPAAAPILVSGAWLAAVESHPAHPAAFWAAPGQAGQDWETFNGWAYAADVVIPIVGLGQEAAWAPSTARSDWGRAAWWIRWFAAALGWVITALGAAAVTGAVRQE